MTIGKCEVTRFRCDENCALAIPTAGNGYAPSQAAGSARHLPRSIDVSWPHLLINDAVAPFGPQESIRERLLLFLTPGNKWAEGHQRPPCCEDDRAVRVSLLHPRPRDGSARSQDASATHNGPTKKPATPGTLRSPGRTRRGVLIPVDCLVASATAPGPAKKPSAQDRGRARLGKLSPLSLALGPG